MRADRDVQRRARFDEMFRANYRAVERFVVARYPTVDRDELVALTFEVAWRRLDEAPDDAIRGWLLGIARNHARNSIRGRRRRLVAVEALAARPHRQSSGLHDQHVPADTVEQLLAALHELRDGDREVIELAAFEDLSGADLGAVLGISAGAASVRLHRARQRLSAIYLGVDL